ncbi:MAG TPA: monofunctional biosynthetic peptidoglycan transglycosylase [Xanthomonadaceae bacterium]|nr:monofunctional biosynthetic peptidoglycan transglycosylase [Xanthomonadaceae bacterium]
MNVPHPQRRIRWLRWLFLWLPLLFVGISVAQVLCLRWIDPPTSAFMVERRIEAWQDGDRGFRLHYHWRPLNEISRWLPMSTIASEDQKFFEHHGFDYAAIDKAFDHNNEGRPERGASTISQQVAKNLFLWSGRNYVRKGLEAWYTVLIEHLWSKQRILEMYVNVAEFGDGIYGADAAAHELFGTTAMRLTPSQCARLAAVLPNPRQWSAAKPGAYVQRRAAWIQRQIGQLGGPGMLSRSRH